MFDDDVYSPSTVLVMLQGVNLFKNSLGRTRSRSGFLAFLSQQPRLERIYESEGIAQAVVEYVRVELLGEPDEDGLY